MHLDVRIEIPKLVCYLPRITGRLDKEDEDYYYFQPTLNCCETHRHYVKVGVLAYPKYAWKIGE